MLKTDWKTKTDLFIKKRLYGILYIKPRKKIFFLPEVRVMKRIFIRVAANFF